MALELYKGDFELQFMEQSKAFYLEFAQNPITNLSSHMIQIEAILKSESERVFECLDVCTHQDLITMIETILISDRQIDLLNHPVFNLFIEQSRTDDLKRIYSLNKLVMDKNPEKTLYDDYRNRWRKWIQAKGEELLNDEELAKKGFRAIEDFIEFRKKAEELVRKVFPNP